MDPTDHDANAGHIRARRGVIGILERNRALLLIRRAPGIPRGGTWCFPGGHVEPGETSRTAIRREFMEELGITVTPTERLGSVRLEDLNYVLAVWRVRSAFDRMTPAADEVAEVRWVTPAQIPGLADSLPSNLDVLALLDA